MANTLLDTRVLLVVGAIRQALTNFAGPGTSVNAHPNPFFLNVIGEVNMRQMAELILERIDKEAAAARDNAAAAVDGH
ncbi:MAG TPA: hypothetical protein VKB76_11840 [Ktedonobacterales bacterium]|nr:hypothetical protein [Ktedonobacterales bacterium]